MPTAPLAVGCLVARSLFSTMDVPARTSWTMSVVPEHRRAATAAITNVPRSLASVPGPMLAGLLLDVHGIGWPLVVAGAIKVLYDLILLAQFGRANTEVASVTRP
jgi:MFS family permease